MITNFQASSFCQTAPYKVLIIEDEPDVVDLLKVNFSNHGSVTIVIAADGAADSTRRAHSPQTL